VGADEDVLDGDCTGMAIMKRARFKGLTTGRR
jgi:hypothetical protein